MSIASTTRGPRRSGFTLIELMVALSAGTIAVASVYYLSGTANQTYSTQMRVAETQMSLRMAADQIRRDFGRAAYLAAPSSAGNAGCASALPRSDVVFQALTVQIDGSRDAVINGLMGAENGGRLDLVQLVGNYATSEDYGLTIATTSGTTQLVVDNQLEPFARSFGADPVAWEAPFEAAFAAGRVVRIEDAYQDLYFRTISASAGATTPPTVTTGLALGCEVMDADKAVISPVSQIQYSVVPVDIDNTPAWLQALDSELSGQRRMALVRQEIDMVTGVAVPGTERLVLDFVTELRVDGVMENPSGSGVFQFVDDTTAPTIETAPVGQMTSLVVTLSARSPDLDRKLTHVNRGTAFAGRVNDPDPGNGVADGAMVTFQVGADPSDAEYGVARVRTMRTEIFLANFLIQ